MAEHEEEFMKVENLSPRSRHVNVTVKVVSKNPVREVVSRGDGSRHQVTEALVGDETGTVFLTLWDDRIESVSEEDVVDVTNGYIQLFRGSMRLAIGRYGNLDLSEKIIDIVNLENNLSDRQYEREPRYGRSRRPYQRGYGQRRDY